MRKLWLTLVITLVACGVERESEDYGLEVPREIVLTSVNHPHGWERSECFACHVKANIHRQNNTGSTSLELARRLVDRSGERSCRGCHGDNGVRE